MVRRLASGVILVGGLFAARILGACGVPNEGTSSGGFADATCIDGARNGDETGVDCGGIFCKKCTGSKCKNDGDCRSSGCIDGACKAPDNKTCGVGTRSQCSNGGACELDADCSTDVCEKAICIAAPQGVHVDGRRNGGETGVDCGGSVASTRKCVGGEKCATSEDCIGACEPDLNCAAPGPQDGKQNNEETDQDCGGPNAPGCAAGKLCLSSTDCAFAYCPEPESGSPRACVTPRNDDEIVNGTETDKDCGGGAPTNAPRCAVGGTCKLDSDCANNGGCNYLKTCVEGPSCNPHFGGDTCGTVGDSCCRTLPVASFSDVDHPGKSVYLDKYEITSGRVRAFVDAMTQKYGAPNIKQWVQDNRPTTGWMTAWEKYLPTSETGETITLDHPVYATKNLGTTGITGTNMVFGRELYVYAHGHNCTLAEDNAYGFPTYWYPDDVLLAPPNNAYASRSIGKDALDQKSMTCIPNAILAAFCLWDGGQLATDTVLEYVASRATGWPGTYNRTSGGTAPSQTLYNVSFDSAFLEFPRAYFSPNNLPIFDGVGRIAEPGVVTADVIGYGGQLWSDMVGNVEEVALKKGSGFYYFDLLFKGIGYNSARSGGNSATYPTGNITFPEYKAGYAGGRCMRFR